MLGRKAAERATKTKKKDFSERLLSLKARVPTAILVIFPKLPLVFLFNK